MFKVSSMNLKSWNHSATNTHNKYRTKEPRLMKLAVYRETKWEIVSLDRDRDGIWNLLRAVEGWWKYSNTLPYLLEFITLSDVSLIDWIMCPLSRGNCRPRSIWAALNAATQIPNHIIQGCISGMSQPFNLTIRVIYLFLVIGKMCQVMSDWT